MNHHREVSAGTAAGPAPWVRRVRGAVLGLLAGAATGLALGVAYWAPAAWVLGVDDLFRQGALAGLFAALASLVFYPALGATFWGAGGAAAGLVVGLGADRTAGFVGAMFGMWVGGALGAAADPETYASALAGVLGWATVGAPVGAVVGHLLGSRPAGWAAGAAHGLLAGMVAMAVGMWFLVRTVEGRPLLLGLWAGVPVATALVGAAIGARRRSCTRS